MKKKFYFLIICVSVLSVFKGKAQQFMNGDLEGGHAGIDSLPPNWQHVPYNDINCQAVSAGSATPDLTDSVDISASAGILGRPYSGLTFISGLYGGGFQEGIMQSVSGLEISKTYTINFHQSVVKQDNALDKSGAWAVYIDNTLVGITAPTHSEAAYNSISFIWQSRNIAFTASATSHLIKFLPVDDDTNGDFSISDTSGALRMGIDAINLNTATGIKNEYNSTLILLYPNPAQQSFTVELPQQQNFNLHVYDVTGRTVFQRTNATGTLTIDCSSFNAGVYFIKAINERTVLTGKLVKQ